MKRVFMIVFLIIYVALFPLILAFVFSSILTNIGILLLYFFLIILNTGTVAKIILDYVRYGDKNQPFKKIEKFTNIDMIIAELAKLDTYQKTLVINNNLIVINEAGIFEFAKLNIEGKVNGDIKDEYWYIKNKRIKNPFILKENAFNYLILNTNLVFNVTGVWLTTRKLLYNTVDKRLNKRVYNKEQIDKIYNDLSNNNVIID